MTVANAVPNGIYVSCETGRNVSGLHRRPEGSTRSPVRAPARHDDGRSFAIVFCDHPDANPRRAVHVALGSVLDRGFKEFEVTAKVATDEPERTAGSCSAFRGTT